MLSVCVSLAACVLVFGVLWWVCFIRWWQCVAFVGLLTGVSADACADAERKVVFVFDDEDSMVCPSPACCWLLSSLTLALWVRAA